MQELTFEQVEEVSGGNPFLLGVGAGIVGNYIYDSIGGMDGINDGFSAVGEFISGAVRNDPILRHLF